MIFIQSTPLLRDTKKQDRVSRRGQVGDAAKRLSRYDPRPAEVFEEPK